MKKETVETLKGMKYEEFLQTDYWKLVSEQARINAHYKCQLCGCKDKKLNVHHNTYEHRGEEFKHMEDLICLCEDCHNFYHNKTYLEQLELYCENSDKKLFAVLDAYDKLKEENEELKQEKDYAEWKLLNFYKAQKGKTYSELACMIKLPNEKEMELPF